MPNYRNKNRNRNKNKQRNKQQQQQQQQQQKQKQENCKKESEVDSTATTAPTNSSSHESYPTPSLPISEVSNATAVYSENNVANINTSVTEKSNELTKQSDITTAAAITTSTNTTTANDKTETETNKTTLKTNDTVLNEPSTKCDNQNKNNLAVNTNDNMGNEKSKIIENQSDTSMEQNVQEDTNSNQTTVLPSTCALGKVIVHRIVCDDSNSIIINKDQQISTKEPATQELNIIETKQSVPAEVVKKESEVNKEKSEKGNAIKVITHTIETSPVNQEENQNKVNKTEDKIQKQQDNQQSITKKEQITSKQITEIIESGNTELLKKETNTEKSQSEQIAKVIIHKVLTSSDNNEENPNPHENLSQKVIVHKVQSPDDEHQNQIDNSQVNKQSNTNKDLSEQQQQQVKVIVHKVAISEDDSKQSPINEPYSQQHEVKVLVHKVQTPEEEITTTNTEQPKQHQAKVIVHQVHLEEKDEEPKITSPTMKKPLATKAKPSTSDVRIVEISDESLSDLEELRSPVVSEAESSTELCDEIQKVSDCITEVSTSTSSTSTTQKQSRKQKRIALEHHFLPQMLNPRFLDSISEENSELSDNSENPLSRSASNESATNCLTEGKVQKLNAKYPKSSLDFSKPHKQQITTSHNRKSKAIREEPLAFAVSARLQDAPDADESCSTVRSCMSPEAEAAEVVFINSASSSMSDLHDMELFENVHATTQEFDLDTDLTDIVNNRVTDNICSESLVSSSSSSSSPSSSLIKSAFTAKIPQQQLPEFCANQNNNYNKNNQIINNSKLINNNTPQKTLNTMPATATNTTNTSTTTTTATNKTRSLADEIKTIKSNTDSILSTSSPAADEQLVFAQIEEQISSVLSSINEVASQNTSTTTTTKTKTSKSSSLLSSSSSSSSTKKKIHTNLSNTQKLPVTITSTTAASRTLETSCEESFNISSNNSLCAGNNAKTPRVFEQNVNMNTVRDLIINNNNNANDGNTVHLNDLKTNANQQNYQQSDDSSNSAADPKKLRLLCAETLASFPYGDAVLEELATVAQNIGEARAINAVKNDNNMPYPLPELPHIDDLQLSLKVSKDAPERPAPPHQGNSWLGVPTSNDPKVLVCLSPSQRSFIQQKPDDLLDAHHKFMERRGYHEYTKEQLETLEREKLAEQQLLKTAAMMKKLRKSITPPPPQIPPPPVPVKSSETASKAQNLSKRTVTTTTITHTQKTNDDANLANVKEQMPAKSNGESNGEENKHRLLSIIQDTSNSNANKQTHSVSSFENNSRQTINGISAPVKEQAPSANSTLSNDTSKNSYQFPQLNEHKGSGNMQSVETTLGQMFPTMGSSNIFDQKHKRFSNIESSTTEPFCSQIMNTQPKRYSSVETHSYETQKRIENGKVVQDFSTSKHETQTSGDKPDEVSSFPMNTSLSQEANRFLRSGKEQDISKTSHHADDQEIMSALNLNNHSSDVVDRKQEQQQTATQSETIIKTTTTETSQNNVNNENKSAKTDEKDLTEKQATENTTLKWGIQNTYDEFRQRAKAAADAASTLPALGDSAAFIAPLTTAKVTSNGDNSVEKISSTNTTTENKKVTTLSLDHEKLFKEFDDLSKQLHRELETSKAEREQRERSASMFDLNKVHMIQKQQIEEFNKSRHEHLKELEQEIERSMRSRSLRFTRPPEPSTDTIDHQTGRTYQIPIHIENSNTTITPAANKTANTYEEAPPVPEPPKTYQIPIQIENSNSSYVNDGRFRRAESMFNLSDDVHHRQRTFSNQMQYQRAEDDWSKYASDLGSSENIVRPFAKEVEICYQRRPGGIRAPRLTASTNDLSFNNQHSYDQYNAYNVKRHHAPMLNRPPEPRRPQFGSCYSMIERDPNPKYISTTTRRGVSPTPQSSGYFPLDGCHVREEDMRQRRASLPREIHDQQLKYIASKEEELRTEFERLQTERRRLMEEAQRAQTMQMPQPPTSPQTPTSPMTRPIRDHYRPTQKLPTLTEDEVFRQQMAEEWLSKVAEREKRRLQNIIKISKIHEDEDASSKHKADMEEEFLSRVKERRHKLAMPADSDWESGAESQPTNQAQLSEAEDVPPVKIIEGEKETSLRRLPRHLREFAKFSNHQKENIEGGHREEHQEEERSEETTDNSVSRAFKKSSVVKTVKTLRAPMLPENGGHENDNYDDYKNDNDNYDDDVNSHDGYDVSTSHTKYF